MKTLALASVGLLLAALTVAEPLGGAFAALGMAGVFILRFRLAALVRRGMLGAEELGAARA